MQPQNQLYSIEGKGIPGLCKTKTHAWVCQLCMGPLTPPQKKKKNHPTSTRLNPFHTAKSAAACFVLNHYHNTSSVSAMNWPTLQQSWRMLRLAMLWKMRNNPVHTDISSKLQLLPEINVEATTNRTHNCSAKLSTDTSHSSPEPPGMEPATTTDNSSQHPWHICVKGLLKKPSTSFSFSFFPCTADPKSDKIIGLMTVVA